MLMCSLLHPPSLSSSSGPGRFSLLGTNFIIQDLLSEVITCDFALISTGSLSELVYGLEVMKNFSHANSI